MTTLVRFVLKHAAIGMVAAVVFVAVLLTADLGGIGSLVARTEGGALAAVVMTVFFGITFGSVQVGMALMLRSWDDDETGGKPRKGFRLGGFFSPILRGATAQPRPAVIHARTTTETGNDR